MLWRTGVIIKPEPDKHTHKGVCLCEHIVSIVVGPGKGGRQPRNEYGAELWQGSREQRLPPIATDTPDAS